MSGGHRRLLPALQGEEMFLARVKCDGQDSLEPIQTLIQASPFLSGGDGVWLYISGLDYRIAVEKQKEPISRLAVGELLCWGLQVEVVIISIAEAPRGSLHDQGPVFLGAEGTQCEPWRADNLRRGWKKGDIIVPTIQTGN